MKAKWILTLAALLFLLFAPVECADDDDDDDDDDGDDDDDDDDTVAEGDDIFELVGRADGDPEALLYGNTAFDFEFEVWANEGAGEAIRKFVLMLPCAEYDLDLDSLVAPTPLTHVGETPRTWQASFDAETYTITYEYLDAAGAAGVGNIRAGENLVFSFSATTDQGFFEYDIGYVAQSIFEYALTGDGDPPIVVEGRYSFLIPTGGDDDDTTGDDDDTTGDDDDTTGDDDDTTGDDDTTTGDDD